MIIDREKFLSAVVAISLGSAAVGCGGEPPPAAEEPAVEPTTGAEQPAAEPEPAPVPEAAAEPAPAPAPAPEPVPEVQQTGPTRE
jgi:outer membrane biosynthesis protein TonB